ncbi:MAG: helix-turn-helix domain-containing protein [Clostridia bacterium]|nr:helix-turn-helix domain-containing protein [Clostridia bacterium]
MHIQYNIPKLEQIIKDLSVLTGISISFLDADGNRICKSISEKTDFCEQIQESNKDACACSDQSIIERCKKSLQFESHICHAGLWDGAMPITKNGVVAGFVLLGRIRATNSPSVPICNDGNALLYQDIPCLQDSQIESFKALLPDILFESAITFAKNSLADEAKEYITKNLDSDLNLKVLCSALNVSKNSLYRVFREAFGTTINEYIVFVRLQKAKELLKNSSLPIYLICEKVGIPNYTYFCKLFKKQTGLTPTEYKKIYFSNKKTP